MDAPPRQVDNSSGSITTVAWLHNKQTILSFGADTNGLVLHWRKVNYNMPCNVESASSEPKHGNKCIAGREEMWVHVFDFHTEEELGCNKGHHGPVHCVRFSPGGESYASGSEDGTIRIWQTGPVTHEENDHLPGNGPSGKVKAVADEVARRIESGLHIGREGKTGERNKPTDA